MEETVWFRMEQFNSDKSFPLFVQYGHHDVRLGRHGHRDYVEMVIVIAGTGTHKVLDRTYELKRGSVFIIPVGVVHSYENVVDMRVINVMFAAEYPRTMVNMQDERLEAFTRLFANNEHYVNLGYYDKQFELSEDRLQQVIFAFDKIIREEESKMPGWKEIAGAMFVYAAVEISRNTEMTDRRFATALAKIEDSRDCINYSFMGNITVSELAARTGYSTRHFVRLFKEIYGMSPMECILDVRLKHACNLLKISSLSISDIAAQSGFTSLSYFSRYFKEKMGVTPRQYREQ